MLGCSERRPGLLKNRFKAAVPACKRSYTPVGSPTDIIQQARRNTHS